MARLKILVLGDGGREHALVWKLAQSERLDSLHAAPGNPGIAELATCHPIKATDTEAVVRLARALEIDLVVVGPEAPLVAGVVGALSEAGIQAFGPSQEAAQLEASKVFTKRLCAEFDIPTAAFSYHEGLESALNELDRVSFPVVVKADGLAAGKGVIIAGTKEEAVAALQRVFGGEFGAAGSSVVLEEFMAGEEASLFLLCDGEEALFFGTAQDHKRLLEGDRGPNTGGMGAYSPTPLMTDALIDEAMKLIVEPTLKGMKAKGIPFCGFLYAGLMITETGVKLVEFNARFGDPECQVVMPRCQSDLVELLEAAASGNLTGKQVEFSDQSALTVVLAAPGYPEAPEKGGTVDLSHARLPEAGAVFQAGTRRGSKGIEASGGRVLHACAWADDLENARSLAYQLIESIDYPGGQFRRDIASRLLKGESNLGHEIGFDTLTIG